MDAKDEVKRRLSVEDVVADYVELKRSGSNYKGLSPWTSEKSASFMVSPEKQIWHDFSSNRGGDIFSFVMEMEGIDFKESLELLARKAGVELSDYQRGDGRTAKFKKRSYEAHELAVKYYQQSLIKSPMALEYVFKQREFSKQAVTEFGIGYAPTSGDALKNFLVKRGFTLNELQKAGLISQRGGDMFRGRMVLALSDIQGRVVGFTGRILKPNPNAPKYLNTPQTYVYDKGRQAYGMHLAKEAIRAEDFAIIVEGNTDVISSHMAGVKNIVAAAGTALTTDHLKQLARFTSNIHLAFDSDSAGLAATERAIGLAQGLDIELAIIEVPGGKDPDEIIKKDPELWRQAVKKSLYVMDWLLQHYQTEYDLSSAAGKRKFSDRVVEVLSTISDPIEQDHYLTRMAEITKTSLDSARKKLASHGKKKPKLRLKKAEPTSGLDKSAREDVLLAVAARNRDVRGSLDKLEETDFSTDQRRAVFKFLIANKTADLRNPVPQELKELTDYVSILLLKADELYGDWNSSDLMGESIGLARRLVNKRTQKTKTYLSKSIRKLEDAGDYEAAEELLKKYQELLKG